MYTVKLSINCLKLPRVGSLYKTSCVWCVVGPYPVNYALELYHNVDRGSQNDSIPIHEC